ncbi:pentatricopeptide repeat-containing protein At3g24000, mitochondrial [Selaginella moellendorffii]|uniref:pentatricopeptide repeat-containing protein At3g24000, mitochondrial n=1 Tax=Selaginella moellendorffii TaxID=88036 RepID=UPI000D1CE152|nr:pentatricopeptide repeat-containing protein At3g24000, mitochondrial [Selaginella moellendorffii]|eukprot:XP_024539685.1 pentatricopeptide repeat-containing protein At3g24000, mitochondrial [Selaginella moellendorffii]
MRAAISRSGVDDACRSYARLLKECGRLGDLAQGKRLHAQIRESGLLLDDREESGARFLGNCLVQMYGKCGRTDEAQRAFDSIAHKNIFSWTSILVAYFHAGLHAQALERFHQMIKAGVEPDRLVFLAALNVCGILKRLEDGAGIHRQIQDKPLDSDLEIGNALVSMYGKCGRLDLAKELFDCLERRNVISWTILVSVFAENGRRRETWGLLRSMAVEGIKPDKVLLLTLLNVCSSRGVLDEDSWMAHDYIVGGGLDREAVVATALLSMFARCGRVDKAREIFEKVADHSAQVIECWNAMITAYAHRGCSKEALFLLDSLQLQGVKPNCITFISSLGACSSLQDGRALHLLIHESGFDQEVSVANALVTMYGKCGSLLDSAKLFSEMAEKDLASWNSAIAAHSYHGRSDECIKLLDQMRGEGFLYEKVTFLTALNSCTDPASLQDGVLMHEKIVQCGYEADTVVASAVINMYGRCGGLDRAREIFTRVKTFDVILWTGMLTVYCQLGRTKQVMEHFRSMLHEGLKPTGVTLVNLITCVADSGLEHFRDGVWISSLAWESGLESETMVANSLIEMFSEFRSLSQARAIFDRNPEKSVALHTTMLAAYVKGERGKEAGVLREHAQAAMELFQTMQAQGQRPGLPTFVMAVDAAGILAALSSGITLHSSIVECGFLSDAHVATALIDMYGKCGDLSSAEKIFQFFLESSRADMVLWTSMMGAYVQLDRCERALTLFARMLLEGLEPSSVTLVTAMSACGGLADPSSSKRVHERARELGLESETCVANGLVDMYGKAGDVDTARYIFDRALRRNVTTWNAMAGAYRQCGVTRGVLWLVRTMQRDGYRPDSVTFVSLLSVCGHSGLLEEARYNFVAMRREFGIDPSPKHYSCVIDLLARAGELQQAEDFIARISVSSPASSPMWMALLGACRSLGNSSSRARRAARNAMDVEKMEPRSQHDPSAAHVALANICAASGNWDEALSIRKAMAEKGLRKEPGRSLIAVKNRLHEFVAGDRDHPRREEIYAELRRLERAMVDRGYVVDTGMVTHNVGEADKRDLLGCHSEKLAVAFGVLSTPPGSSLRIIKNLRACGDCHTAIKLISAIEGREIVVRDSNRFHHFRNGSCSCGDYW